MAEAAVRCPHCQSQAVVRYGKTSNGKERFRCSQSAQCGRTFLRSYAYPGCLPAVKQQIVEMTLNGSGIPGVWTHLLSERVVTRKASCKSWVCYDTTLATHSLGALYQHPYA